MTKIPTFLISLPFVFAAMTGAGAQEEIKSSPGTRTDIRITVYANDFAALFETREIELAAGKRRIAFEGLPTALEPDTVWLEGGGFHVLEHSFDAALLTPHSLIEHALGDTILVESTNPATGTVEVREATVLSVAEGVVLRFEDGIEVFGQGGLPERFRFKHVPQGLNPRPVLSAVVEAAEAFRGDVRLSYLSRGLTWKADYVGRLNAAEDAIDINARITLSNASGTGFENARVQVVAGEVNRVSAPALRAQAMQFEAARADSAAREAVGDYHVYSLPRPVGLRDGETKQAALFAAAAVPVEKFYVFDARGQTETFLPVKVYYEFDNTDENRLGRPFPAGVFRVYAQSGAGEAQFIGESAVANTPEGERVILQPGQAFDVTVSEKQTSYQREEIPDQYPSRTRYRETIGKQITFKNASDQAVTVRFFEHFGANWEILDQSQDHVEEDARTIYWEVDVPANGEATLAYTRRTW